MVALSAAHNVQAVSDRVQGIAHACTILHQGTGRSCATQCCHCSTSICYETRRQSVSRVRACAKTTESAASPLLVRQHGINSLPAPAKHRHSSSSNRCLRPNCLNSHIPEPALLWRDFNLLVTCLNSLRLCSALELS